MTMLDMTEVLRPFFWLMVAIAAVGPLAILLAARRRPHFGARRGGGLRPGT